MTVVVHQEKKEGRGREGNVSAVIYPVGSAYHFSNLVDAVGDALLYGMTCVVQLKNGPLSWTSGCGRYSGFISYEFSKC